MSDNGISPATAADEGSVAMRVTNIQTSKITVASASDARNQSKPAGIVPSSGMGDRGQNTEAAATATAEQHVPMALEHTIAAPRITQQQTQGTEWLHVPPNPNDQVKVSSNALAHHLEKEHASLNRFREGASDLISMH